MRYQLRPGLVLEHVLGKHLLIADENARKSCKYLTELDSAGAEIIEAISTRASIEDMTAAFSREYQTNETEIKKKIEDFLQLMKQNHFLISTENDEKGCVS